MDASWKKRFQPHILERGQFYWKDCRVRNLERSGDEIYADVLGQQGYEVVIRMDGDRAAELSCTCPHAEGGNACKHMAAVLFALENHTQAEQELPWQEIVDGLTAEELREMLAELVRQNPELQELLSLRLGLKDLEQMESEWEAHLSGIGRRYADRHGFIDYSNARDFYGEMEEFLTDRLQILRKKGDAQGAFRLVCIVWESAMEWAVDDSGGESAALHKLCEQEWRSLQLEASEETEQEMYRWFAGCLDRDWWNGTELTEELLFSIPWSRTLQEEKLQLLDRFIENEDDGYRMEELLRWRADTMEMLNCEAREVELFWSEHRSLPFVRRREVDRLIEAEEYEKAIAVLQESKTLDWEDGRLLREYSERLIELYRLTEQRENYEQELRRQVFTWEQRNMEYIGQLREVAGEAEWPALLEQLLGLPTTRRLRLELLAFGGRWQSLLDEIEKPIYGLYQMQKYACGIAEYLPEQTREQYGRMLAEAMRGASGRSDYRNIAAHLQTLKSLDGGAAAAAQLAEEWRQQYPRRSAMLDELENAGF